MNSEAKEKFDTLVSKDKPSLTESDIVFLKARRGYLTEGQLKDYEEIFEPKEEDKKPKEKELTLKELKVRGEVVGLKYKIGTKKVDFEKAIVEAEKEK